jgi:hypothetical protein
MTPHAMWNARGQPHTRKGEGGHWPGMVVECPPTLAHHIHHHHHHSDDDGVSDGNGLGTLISARASLSRCCSCALSGLRAWAWASAVSSCS